MEASSTAQLGASRWWNRCEVGAISHVDCWGLLPGVAESVLGLVMLLFMRASPRRVAKELLDFFEPSVLAAVVF